MFAVVRTGGKQYRVTKGDTIKVEKLEGAPGAVILLEDVLAASAENGAVSVGKPAVNGIKVAAEVLFQEKDEKVIVFKKKRRQNYRRKNGHRQQVTWLKVQDIGANLSAKAAPEKKAEAAAEKSAKKAAPKKAKKEETK